MTRKKFKVKVPESTHWYFTIIVKKLILFIKRITIPPFIFKNKVYIFYLNMLGFKVAGVLSNCQYYFKK